MEWLGQESIPMELVFTKSDRVKPVEAKRNTALFQESIAGWFETPPTMFSCSAVTRHGLPSLLKAIEQDLHSEGVK